VSYLRYTPDVAPPPPELAAPPPSRAARWIVGTCAYLIVLILWTWWMTLPPKLEPPLAIIPLPDGSELRVVYAVRGASFTMRDNDTYGGRIWAPSSRNRNSNTITGPPSTTWLVVTRFIPYSNEFCHPALDGFSIIQGSPPHTYSGSDLHKGQNSWLPTQVFNFPVIPGRAPTWDVAITHGPVVLKATIPNPFYSPVLHELSPRPLPQKVTVGDASITLEKVVIGVNKYASPAFGWNPSIQPSETAMPVFKVLYWDLREDAFAFTHSFLDATGLETEWVATMSPALPFSEPAWGVRVRAVQHTASRTSPEKLFPIGDATVPAPGEMVALPVPPALKAVGITDLVLVGTGSYAITSKSLASLSPVASTVPTLTLAHPGGYGREGVNLPSLFVLSNHPQHSPTEDAIFLLREGEKTATCSINRTSSSGNFYFRRIDFNTVDRSPLTPGAKVTLQFLKPKVIEATFYFPPPAAPVQPAAAGGAR
jgi:hypothetical protein